MDQQQEQQPQAPQAPQAPEAQPDPVTQSMRDEDIMAKALGQIDTPRDERGRFTSQKPQQPQAEAPADPAAQTKDAPKDATQQADAGQEYKWDEVKGIKLKVPFKTGDKEWEEEIPLEELRNRGMMHADYMARRRELDTQLKAEQEKATQRIESERQTYLKNLQTIHQSVMQVAHSELANVDWSKLAQENPAEYVRLANRQAQIQAQLERVRAEHERVTKQQDEERGKRLETAKSEARQKLQEKIPTFNDDLHQALAKRAQDTYGFKPEEFSQVWDHRVLQLFHDAHQFRLLGEKKPEADAKVKDAPPVLKPGNVKPKVNAQEQQFKNAKDRLRRNGADLEAGAELMAAFLTSK